ncbi:hypothetical protein D3M71_11700 [Erwinia billingiae]|nr:hypothetical protein [Erwinia billingiae]QEW32721.1 hypothetical protein D0N50_13995 [Erwinia billingiae]
MQPGRQDGIGSLWLLTGGSPLFKSAVFPYEKQAAEILRPLADHNREVDVFAMRLGAIGYSRPALLLPVALSLM